MNFSLFGYGPTTNNLPEHLAQINIMLQNNYVTLARL